MKIFQRMQLHKAIEYAAGGGVAIHLHNIVFPKSPKCFRDAVARGESIAHVFGQDRQQLVSIAKRMGVRVIVVERQGTSRQHVDMCGKPLKKLLAEVGNECGCGQIACVCHLVAGHVEGCRLRTPLLCPVSVECPHGRDVCPECDPCTCSPKGRKAASGAAGKGAT